MDVKRYVFNVYVYTWKSYQWVTKKFFEYITVKFQHYRQTQPMPIVTIPVSHVTQNSRCVCCVNNTWRHMSVNIDVKKSAREKLPVWDWQKTAVEKKSTTKLTTVVRLFIISLTSRHVSSYLCFQNVYHWILSYIWILCLAR